MSRLPYSNVNGFLGDERGVSSATLFIPRSSQVLTTHLSPGVPVDQIMDMPQVSHRI